MYYQNENKGCAYAVIKNLLIYVYKDEKMSLVQIDKDIDSFYKMKEVLKKFDLEYEGYKIDNFNELQKKNFPLVAQIKNGESLHFVLIYKITKNHVYYQDSDNGELRLNIDEFKKIFTGNVLVKESDKIKKIKNISLLPKKIMFPYFLFFIFQFVFLQSALYFLSQNESFPLPIVFLLASIIVILGMNFYNTRVRNYYDKNLIIPYLNKYYDKNDFIYLSKMIDELIKKINYIYNYLLVSILITIILLNNPFQIVILAIISLLIIFIMISNKKSINFSIRKAKIKEDEFKRKLDKKIVDDKLLFDVKKEISKSFFSNVYPLIVEFILISLVIIYNMFLDKNKDINNYIFYIFLTFTYTSSLYSLSKEIISYDKIALSISSLNHSISEFLVKKRSILLYTNNKKSSFLEGEYNETNSDKT